MPAEHLRIMDNGYIGIYQGYYCMRCGQGGLNMYGTGHPDDCTPNPTLVAELKEINRFGEEMVGLHYSDLIDILP